MKKYLILPLCATFCLTAGCAEDFPTVLNHDYYEENTTPAQPDVTEQTVRLGTYNLWISNKGTGDYLWTNRRDVLAQSIVNNDWDIFGFQEANATIQSELPKLVADKGGNYEWWFVGRDSQDGKSGEALGIAYDPDRFTLSDQHYYWLSETPDEMSYGWDELGYHRVACCAVVTDKRYGKQFLLTVTHLPLADMARSEAAKLIVEREQMYNKPGMPSVLVGDMNATPDDAASATFRTCWNDAYQAVDARFISGPVGTFNGHKTSTDLSVSTARIDYIYTRGSLALKSYRVDNSIYGGIYPSDHCPVSIQVDFNYDAPEPPQIEGAGTESDPWQINSTADWNAVAESINGAEADATYLTTHFYALTADIDFKGQSLLPISYAASTIYFQGEFDGRGHTIRNVTMTASGSSFGLFGANDGRIHDLNVEDLSLSTAFKTAGGVVGTNRGVIDGVTFRGRIVGTGVASVLGGIAGQNQGVIVNCGNRGGSIEAVDLNSGAKGENLGGIVGQISKGSDGVGNYVINCYSWIERIASNNNNLGGIVGIVSDDSFVINCYATLADVTQNDSYASSVGYNKKGNVWNVYGNKACPSGQKNADWIVGNDSKMAGSVWAESVGALLSLDEMKSGAVTVPSSDEECASLVEALNTGAELYDQLPDGTLPTKPVVSLREWVASDTYPVLK